MKTRQLNFRIDNATFEQIVDLAAVIGASSIADALRDLIASAHKKLTPAMKARIKEQRSFGRSARNKILGE